MPTIITVHCIFLGMVTLTELPFVLTFSRPFVSMFLIGQEYQLLFSGLEIWRGFDDAILYSSLCAE